MKLVYLASPYTHENKFIMNLRAGIVGCVAAKCFVKYGHEMTFFSPIVHGHGIVNTLEGKAIDETWGFWEPHCISLLSRSDRLWVVCLDGWKESIGVKGEIEYAENHGIPIRYISADGELS